ncbi:MAG: hypothetical protein U0694_21730 [Anaerolineae bacterium]
MPIIQVAEALLNEKTRYWEVGDTIPVYYYPMFPASPLLSPVDSQVIYMAAGLVSIFYSSCFWRCLFLT